MSAGNPSYDAVVVGSGPNGFTAAITLARAGLSVLLIEGKDTLGGACRTAELTLPGFQHDTCAAIHPMAVLSPVFREIGLESLGVQWAQPPVPLAHPLSDGRVALLKRSVEETADALGPDKPAWKRMLEPLARLGPTFFEDLLRPIRFPRHPLAMMRFGRTALRSCESVVNSGFSGELARALFAGCSAHAILPLDQPGTASFGVVLALSAHVAGWPCAKGGSQAIINALATAFRALGGVIETGRMVQSVADLPLSRAVLFDLSPRQLAAITAHQLPSGHIRRLNRFRYGPGVFKLDWALDGPIPWQHPDCLKAATVHVGGSAEEIIAGEKTLHSSEPPEKPFVLVAQQSLFDPGRAPEGKQTGWAYCHVPNGCTIDMTERIERQIERFAPGFRDRILARHATSPAMMEARNPNLIGGDIGGGANDLRQVIFRPFPRLDPYATPNKRLFLCSSSTPPGGGVHGMCGYWAARSALKKVFGQT